MLMAKRDRTLTPCSKCRGPKEGFNHAYCRPCFAAWCRERRAASPEAAQSARNATKKWRASHRDEATRKVNEWRAANPDKVKAMHQRWYEKHGKEYRDKPGVREKIRKSGRESKKRKYDADPASACARQRRVNVERKEYNSAYKSQCRIDRPAFHRLQDRMRAERDWAKRRALYQNYRTRLAGAKGSHTAAEWKSVLRHYKRRCYYCNVKLTSATISEDHKVPIKRGGTNYINNIVPACKRCNSRKHTKTAEEFLASHWFS